MAQLIVRNLEGKLVKRLRERAARSGDLGGTVRP